MGLVRVGKWIARLTRLNRIIARGGKIQPGSLLRRLIFKRALARENWAPRSLPFENKKFSGGVINEYCRDRFHDVGGG